uniref:Uncharacterized protein n=1 Tax=Rhizophora mucronata TaxID=61149 RepID=A0A2P2NNY6_RHIMU
MPKGLAQLLKYIRQVGGQALDLILNEIRYDFNKWGTWQQFHILSFSFLSISRQLSLPAIPKFKPSCRCTLHSVVGKITVLVEQLPDVTARLFLREK